MTDIFVGARYSKNKDSFKAGQEATKKALIIGNKKD